LLSQLPCLPEQYVRAARTHTAEEVRAWSRHVVGEHLAYLQRLSGVVCLIADVEAITLNVSGAEVGRRPTLYGVDLPFEGERWIWPVVARKRAFPQHAEHLVVVGVVDVKEARREPLPPAPSPKRRGGDG